MRYALFLILASVGLADGLYGRIGGVSANGISNAIANSTNCKIVYPGDDVQAAYDWLKSSDRDAQMGALSASNRRVLILMPGKHILTAQLAVDTDFVDLSGITGNPMDTRIYTHTTNSEAAVKQTANSADISNLTIQSDGYGGSVGNCALEIANGKEGTDGVMDHQVTFDEIAITSHNAAIGDWVRIWGGSTPIANPDWYEVTGVAGNELKIDKNAAAADATNVSYEIVYKSRWSRYFNCRFVNFNNYYPSHGYQSNSGLYVSSGNFGGEFRDCYFTDFSCGIEAYYDTLAHFYNCTFGNQCLGIDEEGCVLNATVRNCSFGHNALGGCGQFGCTIGKYARIEYVTTGFNSVALSRTIESGAEVRHVQAGLGSIAGYQDATLTGGTGDNNGTVLTFTGAAINANAGFYGAQKGRLGLEVYITGTNVTSGWYSVSAFDDTADTITLAATCGDGGGAMSAIVLHYKIGQIKGLVEYCSIKYPVYGAYTEAAELANENVAPGRISGIARNTYLEDVAKTLP